MLCYSTPPPLHPPSNIACGVTDFVCSDSKCVAEALRCDGQYDCSDGGDERGCREYKTNQTQDYTLSARLL